MKLFSVLMLILFSIPAMAQPASVPAGYKYEVKLTSENDNYAFTYKDGYYTNGIFLQLNYVPARAEQYLKLHSKLGKLNTYYMLGQMIYNAETWRKQTPPDIDRPYAGYLFARKGFVLHYKNQSVMDFSVSAGTTGPASGARQVQKFYHSIFHLPRIRAWEYQLNGEPALNFRWVYHQNMLRTDQANPFTQLHATLELNAGNVFTNASGGLLLKAGKLQKPQASTFYQSGTGNNDAAGNKKRQGELFVFFHPQLMTQIYNATIQGPLFKKDKGPITGKPVNLYYFHQFGLYFVHHRIAAAVVMTYKNREAEAMRIKERYGGLMLAYRFGVQSK
ncbi:MAG: lipid A deacylase LpxR family protein [Chitinophagaceae bacterium]|nr:lipid A deacylase LpxR family protein [Chitinophagaceae bacterium]MBL0337216.1 lipid A deacylase LpxR family protein [Chitinophagaceae bacterium]